MKSIYKIINGEQVEFTQPDVNAIRTLMKEAGFKVNVRQLNGSMGHTVMIWARSGKVSQEEAKKMCDFLNETWDGSLYNFDGKKFQVLHAFNGNSLDLCVSQQVWPIEK